MLINLETSAGYLLVNTDNIDCVYFCRTEGKVYITRKGINESKWYYMREGLIDKSVEQINEQIKNENKQKTNTD